MRLSELLGKEMIDYTKGEKLGVLTYAEFTLDEQNGYIHSLEIPVTQWSGLRKQKSMIRFKWNRIYRIGEETILIDPRMADVQSGHER